MRVTRGHQGGQQFRDVIGPSGFHRDVDGGVAQVDAVVGAVVSGLDDVGAMIGEDSGEAVQRAGIVGQVNAQANQASIFHQAALDDAREQGDVDIAAADEDGDSLPLQRQLAVQHGGNSGSSGAFRQGFLALQQQKNRIRDFFLFHGNDVVDVFLHQRERAFSGPAHGNAIGDRLRGVQRNGLALGHRGFHGRNSRRLHSENLNRWIGFFDRAGDSANEPSAADGRDNDLDVRMLLQDFQSQSSLPGDDRVVVESVNQRQSVLPALLDGLFVGFVVIGAVQHNFGAVSASRRNFRQRRGKRHHDARLDVVPSRVVRDALRMIAGGGGDHATGAFIASQREQFVQRAALFESSGALLVIELQENGIVGQAGKCFRVRAGRDANVSANSVRERTGCRKVGS